MKSLPIKKLIAEKISGEWGSDVSDPSISGVAVIRTANFLNTGKVDFSNIVRRDIDQKKVNKKKLISGDIIIEKSGGSPKQPVGRVVLFENPDEDTYLCNNFTTILRPDRELIYPEYLFYVLFDNHQKGKTLRYQNKTTGIINLKLDNYLSSEIPLPPLADQKRIAHLLGKVEGLIARRKQHLQQLDALLKSVFLEMFGDPVRNEKGWDEHELGKVIKIKHGFAFKSEFFSDKGPFVLLTPGNFFEEGGFRDRGDRQKYYTGEIPQEYILDRGDLLVAMTEQAPGLLGSPLIVPEGNLFLHNQRLGLVVPKESIQAWFLFHLFNQKSIRQIIHSKATGTKVRHTSPTKLESIVVGYPPIDLQNQFAAIVERVEVLKSRYQQSLVDLEQLYGALSQKAFKGELDLSNIVIETQMAPLVPGREEKTSKSELLSPESVRQLPNTQKKTDNEPFNLDYVKQFLATKNLKVNLTYLDMKKALAQLPYDLKPQLNDIQQLILNLLESEPPFLEQVFDYAHSNSKEKQILFRMIDEN